MQVSLRFFHVLRLRALDTGRPVPASCVCDHSPRTDASGENHGDSSKVESKAAFGNTTLPLFVCWGLISRTHFLALISPPKHCPPQTPPPNTTSFALSHTHTHIPSLPPTATSNYYGIRHSRMKTPLFYLGHQIKAKPVLGHTHIQQGHPPLVLEGWA